MVPRWPEKQRKEHLSVKVTKYVLFCFSPTVIVPGLFWCNFLYLVTTAGFVADQLIITWDSKQERVRFCVILFSFIFFLQYSWVRYGFLSSCIFEQWTHRDASCVYISFAVRRIRCSCPLVFMPGLFRRLQGCFSCVACWGAFYVVTFCLFLLFVLLFVFSVSCWSRRCLLSVLLSSPVFPAFLRTCIPVLIWFDSVYILWPRLDS